MVGFVKGSGSPPPSLTLGQNCEGWKTLPDNGGYLDQDYTMMSSMNIALNIYRVVNKVKGARGSAIHLLSPSERRLIKPLMFLFVIV